MRMSAVKVYDQNQKLLAVLDAANDVGYELKHNDLSTGSFQLPTLDPRNEYCAAHNYVQIEDGERDLGLFRIIGMPQGDTDDWTGYELEHVMATLVDDVLFGQHEVGGTGVFTADVIAYILARQTVIRWQLGVCDFTDQFAYNFENCTLLSALYSISNLLVNEYTWDFDTRTTPWTVNLRRADLTPGCGIHYMRNLKQIEKTMDATALVTRLYCLGYGEGVNQLTIKSVNGGLPYLDADTIGTWGVKCSVFVDTTIQDAATLKQRAQAVLEGYKNPYITYTATAADLYALTGHSWDNYLPGKLVQVMDGEHGITFQARIISIRKADVNGKPQDIEITIANAQKDTADSINQLADRVGISELYSQGATSLYVFQYAENCTPGHPATFSIPIPQSAVRINVVKFLLKREAYRADAQGAASGGGSVSTTSSGGGGTTTSAAGGAQSITEPVSVITSSNTTGNPKDMDSGYTKANTDVETARDTGASSLSTTGSAGAYTDTGAASGFTSSNTASHVHDGNSHRHYVGSTGTYSSYGTFTTDTSDNTLHSHGLASHTHTTGAHAHSMSHTHGIPTHTHGMNHYHMVNTVISIPPLTINIPDHTHSVSVGAHSHSLTLNDHTHSLIYDIYEGPTANSFAMTVDGVAVSGTITDAEAEVDITALLSKDADGKIERGKWHEVVLTPDQATRVVVNVYAQVFVQSKGGGDY